MCRACLQCLVQGCKPTVCAGTRPSDRFAPHRKWCARQTVSWHRIEPTRAARREGTGRGLRRLGPVRLAARTHAAVAAAAPWFPCFGARGRFGAIFLGFRRFVAPVVATSGTCLCHFWRLKLCALLPDNRLAPDRVGSRSEAAKLELLPAPKTRNSITDCGARAIERVHARLRQCLWLRALTTQQLQTPMCEL